MVQNWVCKESCVNRNSILSELWVGLLESRPGEPCPIVDILPSRVAGMHGEHACRNHGWAILFHGVDHLFRQQICLQTELPDGSEPDPSPDTLGSIF